MARQPAAGSRQPAAGSRPEPGAGAFRTRSHGCESLATDRLEAGV
ncbi:hypothetical protein GCM10018790_15820 [Kitasatospora xanthocidica]|nr:hypothetical protein GCM10018790_15820 [Kitasatospora xanthocidica]